MICKYQLLLATSCCFLSGFKFTVLFRLTCSAIPPTALQVGSTRLGPAIVPQASPTTPGTNPDFSLNFFFRPSLLFLPAADQLQGHSLPANSFPYLGFSGSKDWGSWPLASWKSLCSLGKLSVFTLQHVGPGLSEWQAAFSEPEQMS